MHRTDQLGIAMKLAIVVAATHTGFGALGRTALRSANQIVDAYRLDYAASSLNGSTNPPEIRTGKSWQLCANQQLSGEAIGFDWLTDTNSSSLLNRALDNADNAFRNIAVCTEVN